MSIYIDVPQVAYRTWVIDVKVYGEIDEYERQEIEDEIERGMRKRLSAYPYSPEHDHIK